ncbi:hypothetical protein L5515_005995 [Caenorhabditis briggsae]|uniref:THAP-type domain-containing protein n=1 Tax=Caenorhabditis briggsae TaxID=6238 RepID=A0AAE9F0D4_CAEBR|nr:hypothetical protein L5515_005995 [Caenorhabditis briggsae]
MKERRCCYCWKMMPSTVVTMFTRNGEERKKWIEALGEGFAKQMQNRGDKISCICKSHLPEECVRKRRSSDAIPFVSFLHEAPTSSSGNVDFDMGEPSDAMDLGDDDDEEEGVDDDEEEYPDDDEEEDLGEDEENMSVYEPSSDDSMGGESDESEESGETGEDDFDSLEYVLVGLEQVLEILKFCRLCSSDSVGVSMGKPTGYAVTVSYIKEHLRGN